MTINLLDAKCDNDAEHKIVLVEYGYDSPHSYDGVSEIKCVEPNCGRRVGRWCGNRLEEGELEPRYCKGGEHPKV